MTVRGVITKVHRLAVGDVVEIDIPSLLPQVQRLGVSQCAERYGVSKATIGRWVKTGKLPFFKIGEAVFFDPTCLDEFERGKK